MSCDPSDPGDLRTSSTSGQIQIEKLDRATIIRASFGWSLMAVCILVGFGVSARVGSTDSPSDPVSRVSDTLPAVSTSAATDLVADSTAASAVSFADARGAVLATRTDSAPEALARAGLMPDEAGVEYALATRPIGAVQIEELPIYRSDPSEHFAESLTIVTRGEIGRGESLGSSLRRQGISPGTVHLVATEMRKVFDFRRSRPGDEYRLGQDSDGRVLDFRYSQSAEESFYLAWNGTRYVVRKEMAELRPQVAKIAGVVDSSFYDAILELGEQSALASDFARILAWDIDFSRSVHPGDEFQILYERLYRVNDDGEDVYVRPGQIFAARYEGRTGEHTVVYFEGDDGDGAYFRPDGSSVERAFLAAPLEFSRISSRFTWARRHPILNVTRPHPGIDYVAPHGTPVWSVAEGVVEYKARAGASGNLIRVRHRGGLTSHYAHLASFATNLKVGDRVEQKQIIGFVGSTGLSTGPHVCFRVKRDGEYVDPLKISGPAGEPVDTTRLAVFRNVRDQLLADLGSGPLRLSDEAL
ncbi:MAG: M23 family metallopeptidase [bacterium]|nr:hypothetical protein [Deltaproteobacteria bacterium]MCP4904117.1 M23 family metallopeptidase [bacterium]